MNPTSDVMTSLRKRTIEINNEYDEARKTQSEKVAVAQLALALARSERTAQHNFDLATQQDHRAQRAERERDDLLERLDDAAAALIVLQRKAMDDGTRRSIEELAAEIRVDIDA